MEYSVDSWRDILRKVIDELYYLDKEIFKSLINHKNFKGVSKRRINNSKDKMSTPHETRENLYIELHESSIKIVNYYALLVEKFEMKNDIFIILKPRYNLKIEF